LASIADPDEDLVRRVGQGDPAAIQAMVARKLPRMLALAQRMLGDATEAEDAPFTDGVPEATTTLGPEPSATPTSAEFGPEESDEDQDGAVSVLRADLSFQWRAGVALAAAGCVVFGL